MSRLIVNRSRRKGERAVSNKKKQIEPIADRLLTPGLALPKGRRGLLTWKWAERRLKKGRNFSIATVRRDGRPHVMVIWGLWFNRVMYFSTGPQSQKAYNLERNHNCVISTEQNGEAVIIEAVARTVSALSLRKDVLTLYQRKYNWDMRSLGNTIYAAHPIVAFGMDEKKGPRCSARWKFPSEPE
jgi:hypothetical protein